MPCCTASQKTRSSKVNTHAPWMKPLRFVFFFVVFGFFHSITIVAVHQPQHSYIQVFPKHFCIAIIPLAPFLVLNRAFFCLSCRSYYLSTFYSLQECRSTLTLETTTLSATNQGSSMTCAPSFPKNTSRQKVQDCSLSPRCFRNPCIFRTLMNTHTFVNGCFYVCLFLSCVSLHLVYNNIQVCSFRVVIRVTESVTFLALSCLLVRRIS